MYCAFCGKRLPVEAKFCPGCGKGVSVDQKPVSLAGIETLLQFFEDNPNAQSVAHFTGAVVPKTARNHVLEVRPPGRITVLPEHFVFLTVSTQKYGDDPIGKVVAREANEAYCIYETVSEVTFSKLVKWVLKFVADGGYSNAEEKWWNAAMRSPNSLIIPLSDVTAVRVGREIEVPWMPLRVPPDLQISTVNGDFFVYDDKEPAGFSPDSRVVSLVSNLIGEAIHGWKPELVAFLKERSKANSKATK